jgi:hypothetical protein
VDLVAYGSHFAPSRAIPPPAGWAGGGHLRCPCTSGAGCKSPVPVSLPAVTLLFVRFAGEVATFAPPALRVTTFCRSSAGFRPIPDPRLSPRSGFSRGGGSPGVDSLDYSKTIPVRE